MDKIWYRNPSKWEVIGRCVGDEKTNDHAEPTKVERKKTHKKNKPKKLQMCKWCWSKSSKMTYSFR